MSPGVVLGMLAGLGGRGRPHPHRRVRARRPWTEGIGLSPPVAAAVDRAVEAVDDVLAELCRTRSANGDRPMSPTSTTSQ